MSKKRIRGIAAAALQTACHIRTIPLIRKPCAYGRWGLYCKHRVFLEF